MAIFLAVHKLSINFRDLKGDFMQVERKLRSAVEAMKEVDLLYVEFVLELLYFSLFLWCRKIMIKIVLEICCQLKSLAWCISFLNHNSQTSIIVFNIAERERAGRMFRIWECQCSIEAPSKWHSKKSSKSGYSNFILI